MSEGMHLEMERNLSLPIPEPRFPDDYIVIRATEDSGRLWEAAMDACFGNHEAGSFRYVIVANAFYSEDRAFVVLNEKNEPVATSNSWETGYVNNVKKGYISFVGVVPSYQGRGLAIHVLNYTLRDIKKRGFDKAVIHVDEFNYPALKTYLNGGFLPVIKKQEEIEHWNNIYRHLSIPIPD